MRIVSVAAAAAVMIGCGPPNPAAQAGVTATDSTPRVQAPAPDRIGPAPEPAAKAGRLDTAHKANADTTKPAAPPKRDDRLRDSTVGPMYMVDSTGKVTKIKKP